MHFSAEFNYFDAMASAQKSYAKLLEPICQEWKLTRTELNVIVFLYNNPGYDRAADIVAHRGIAKSHVSLSVASLEEKGLLRRRYSELDRRTAHLELLEQGQRIAAQAREKQVQYFSALYRGVAPEELEIWKNITQKVWDNIKKLETAEEFL
jgi:MarR family transcriptional regulator for hemolysin